MAQLLLQSRSLGEEEVFEFCRRVSMLLQTKEFGADTMNCLQRLRFVIFSTKKPRRLPREALDKLLGVVLFADSPKRVRRLCAVVLCEASPLAALNLPCGKATAPDPRSLCCLAPVVLAQANGKGELGQVRTRILELLEIRQVPEDPDIRLLLPILSRTIVLEPHMMLTEEQVISMNKRLARWLRHLGAAQSPSNTHLSFFSISRGRQSSLLELDGCVSSDFFTVLCQAQPPTDAHWLSVQAFSMLRLWLSNTRPQLDSDKMSAAGSDISGGSGTFRQSSPRELLARKAAEYCLRLMEQSTRRATNTADTELQKACVEEALAVLDLLCQSDAALIPMVLAASQRLMSWLRLVSPQHTRLLLSILAFSLKHGAVVAADLDSSSLEALCLVTSRCFHEAPVVLRLLRLCREHRTQLCKNGGAVQACFPGILKMVAWHTSMIADWLKLLPAMFSPDSSLEMLHALLDLPCLAAALQLLRMEKGGGHSLPPPACMQAFRQPEHQLLFNFLLRGTAGSGETIDRLHQLHKILHEMVSHSRVMQAAQSATLLLPVFFRTLAQCGDHAAQRRLFPALLERSWLLLPSPGYEENVLPQLSSELMRISKAWPDLLLEHSVDIVAFLSAPAPPLPRLSLFIHVVWIIGEYVQGSADTITLYYNALETLTSETLLAESSPTHSARLLSILAVAMAKLALKIQDLNRRLQLSLNKIYTQYKPSTPSILPEEPGQLQGKWDRKISEDHWTIAEEPWVAVRQPGCEVETLLRRIRELLDLMRYPAVAQMLLGNRRLPSAKVETPPGPDFTGLSTASVPAALRTIGAVLGGEA
uniref:AP-5 complex subunit zeta-1 isoform X2 n=1 Tax=Myxine glutinosa TaxID=7769 RepID=UPI00358FEBBA